MSRVLEGILGLPVALALALVFLLPAIEASAFVGVVVPGEIGVILGGVLANQHRLPPAAVLVAGIAGAVIGDSVGYLVGRRYGRRLLLTLPRRLVKPEHIDRTNETIGRLGGRAVFVGRFTTALRALVPGLAGMAGMRYRTFLPWNMLGGASPSPPPAERCASGPRQEALVAYAPPPGTYTLAIPGRWARISSPDGITVSHRLDSLRLEQVPYGSPSTAASFRSNELPGLREATRGFRLRRLGTVALPAGSAVLAQYDETVPGPGGPTVERDVQRYELWHTDQRMVLTMASPCGSAAAPLWRRITESFRWRR